MPRSNKLYTILCETCGASVETYAKRRRFCDTCSSKREHVREAGYAKNYRKANPEKIKQNNKDSYAKNPEYYKQHNAVWRKEHWEKRKADHKQWIEDNPEQWKEHCRKNYRLNKAPFREEQNALARARYAAKPELYRATKCRNLVAYRARLAGAPGNWTNEQFEEVCNQLDWCCYYCGEQANWFTVDHMQPLSRGGSNDISNIVPACKYCNFSKCDKTADEFLEYLRNKSA